MLVCLSPALNGELWDSSQEDQLCLTALRPVQTVSCFRLGTMPLFIYTPPPDMRIKLTVHRCIYFPYTHQETTL